MPSPLPPPRGSTSAGQSVRLGRSNSAAKATHALPKQRTSPAGSAGAGGSGSKHRPAPGPTVVLVLADPGAQDRFLLLRRPDGSWGCPQFEVPERGFGSESLGGLIVSATRDRLDLEIDYQALIGLDLTHEQVDLTVLTVLALLRYPLAHQLGLEYRSMSVEEIRVGQHAPQEVELIQLAAQRRFAESLAGSFDQRMNQAITRSAEAVSRGRTREGDCDGWSQYLDGDVVGVLSTAQGILSYVYAGSRGPDVDDAIETLLGLQNVDGGWQVRRALVGASSSLSITESTCAALAALITTGRSSAPEVGRGLEWLRAAQGSNGGWRSSAAALHESTFATALAVRVLHDAGDDRAVRAGVNWLIKAQHRDGGWGPDAGSLASHPAFTAHALIALATVAPQRNTDVIENGVEYLIAQARFSEAEPWAPTFNNFIVDTGSRSRLEYKHFTTPWALAALSLAGRDLSDDTVLRGTVTLLELGGPDGTWATSLVSHDTSALWAIHDVLFALHTISRTNASLIAGMATSKYRDHELELLDRAVLAVAPRTPRRGPEALGRRGLIQLAWLSALTVAVAVVLLAQFGALQGFGSPSMYRRSAALVVTVVTVLLGALGPPIITTEYRLWRDRQEERKRHGT